ncbi:hypothetical protein GIB67_023896 [Kingdonia uniflora]|uniref:Uncharacterized protein n=1 Tax=Kingdonia uniflora TaxID=39325 RepID=A0A7J7NG73_9MAGN|nr:hypothetical protein GIB67_023896 [Kingdonia uniflora]
MVDNLKEVEERARLAVLQGEEDTSKMVTRLVKGIWLGIEEEKNELKKANIELEKELARSRADALKDVMQLKASHAVAIGQLKVETKVNLDEMVEEYDRLGCHLMLKGYSDEEVDDIKADTYVKEEDEEEAEAVGIVDGLDGISCQTVLDNEGDNVELPEGGSEKVVREMSLRINDLEYGLARKRETSKALLYAQVELQGHVQKGNANLRECMHKLDAALIREKVLEGEIKLEENVIYHAKVNAEMIDLKYEYARLESRLEWLRAIFVTMVIPDASRSDLLKAIVAYFVEEVKRLELERDALLKTLSDKECICEAKIDRGNCLGVMETQLGPRTTKLIESSRAGVTRELKV